MAQALIMAGGQSKRMRQAGDDRHKALVPIMGMPMLERTLRYVIGSGFADVVVAVNAQEYSLVSYVERTASAIATALGGTCSILKETAALGTIGVVREVQFEDALLVVNVDNMTTLPLLAMAQQHRASGAALTIAAHRHPLPLDFGELIVHGGEIVEYREKPVRHPLVSSGVYVLSPAAARCIGAGESIGIPALFSRMKAQQLRILPFEHDSPWVDVNDLLSLHRAESLFSSAGWTDS